MITNRRQPSLFTARSFYPTYRVSPVPPSEWTSLKGFVWTLELQIGPVFHSWFLISFLLESTCVTCRKYEKLGSGWAVPVCSILEPHPLCELFQHTNVLRRPYVKMWIGLESGCQIFCFKGNLENSLKGWCYIFVIRLISEFCLIQGAKVLLTVVDYTFSFTFPYFVLASLNMMTEWEQGK